MANGRKGRNWGGVYVFRTRRPGLIGRPHPILGWMILAACVGIALLRGGVWWLAAIGALLLQQRHFAYVGEGHVRSRYRDHLEGSVKYNAFPKPWADLRPTWYFVALPYWKPLLRMVETLFMLLLWPVYNHQKNLWNPRRIPLKTAKRQRGQRDMSGWSFNLRPAHIFVWIGAVTLTLANHGWGLW